MTGRRRATSNGLTSALRRIAMVTFICLAVSACAKERVITRTQIVEKPVRQYVELPSQLTKACTMPQFMGLTYGDAVEYTTSLQAAFIACALQIKGIGELDTPPD